MKTRLYILTVFVLISLLCFSSCGLGHIDDSNGEDTSVVTISDDDITHGNSHAATLSSKGQANGTYYYNVQRLSGVFSLNKHSVTEPATITMTSNLISGNARICVVLDGEIVGELPIGESQTLTLSASGLYEIKIAAESARLSLEYTVE